jgi:hypothetical protein
VTTTVARPTATSPANAKDSRVRAWSRARAKGASTPGTESSVAGSAVEWRPMLHWLPM